jgi:carbamoyltransferase
MQHRPQAILGLNAYHGDASAALLVDGRLVCAVEEERLVRQKHWAGLPVEAVRTCLDQAGLDAARIDHIAINRDPRARLLHKLGHALSGGVAWRGLVDRLSNRRRLGGLVGALERGLGLDPGSLGARVHSIEHHRAHLASAFLVSPFERAAVASIDGFGDFASCRWGLGHGAQIDVFGGVGFPHSLGIFYQALTQFLGFPNYGDEYKLMGLVAYGEPRYEAELRRLIAPRGDGGFRLDLRYFLHQGGGVPMTWEGGEPKVGRLWSPALEELLGSARQPGEPLEQRHRDLAASVQQVYERLFYGLLEKLARLTGETRLCLAGGCAMNSLANGRIAERTPFREVWIQPAAGDAGGSLGAAIAVWRQELGGPKTWVLESPYLGPRYDAHEVDRAVRARLPELSGSGIGAGQVLEEAALLERIARHLAAGHVVGWFHGPLEWGPRALGARSILADPRRADMQALLNQKIKRRESFRPFAPAVLAARQGQWFTSEAPVPFMGQVFPVRPERRDQVPAIVHADGTGRLQTVDPKASPRFHRLIEAFERLTGVPMLLNTSFNENEPIVCRPAEALDCFLRTRMDVLVLEDRLLERTALEAPHLAQQLDQLSPALPRQALEQPLPLEP